MLNNALFRFASIFFSLFIAYTNAARSENNDFSAKLRMFQQQDVINSQQMSARKFGNNSLSRVPYNPVIKGPQKEVLQPSDSIQKHPSFPANSPDNTMIQPPYSQNEMPPSLGQDLVQNLRKRPPRPINPAPLSFPAFPQTTAVLSHTNGDEEKLVNGLKIFLNQLHIEMFEQQRFKVDALVQKIRDLQAFNSHNPQFSVLLGACEDLYKIIEDMRQKIDPAINEIQQKLMRGEAGSIGPQTLKQLIIEQFILKQKVFRDNLDLITKQISSLRYKN